MKPWSELTPERRLDLEAIEDLVGAGYMRGEVSLGQDGIPETATTRGPTLAGRIFAEEQQEILRAKSLCGRIRSGSVAFIGWLSGILSALLVWYCTK